jgi:hypothetical protein
MSTNAAKDRWPRNRARHDTRLEALEQLKIAHRIESLEKRVTELEGMLAAKAPAPPPAPVEPPAPPAP